MTTLHHRIRILLETDCLYWSGLGENLAAALAMPVERIAVKGSAAAAVRTNLYRKAAKDADWIKSKKFVIWCFSAREFTESTSGWPKVCGRTPKNSEFITLKNSGFMTIPCCFARKQSFT